MQTRPLSEIPVRDLRPLLAEEAEHWSQELLWDFADVSSAVACGLERSALSGFVLQEALRTVAYCYYLHDNGRTVVGSLFAVAGFRGQGLEERLLEVALHEAQTRTGTDRVECQTLFSTAAADSRFAQAGFHSRLRHYLARPLAGALPSAPAPARLRPLRRDDLAQAADIIHRSHQGTLDAALNMTYSTQALCRGFVDTLVLRAGCGRFASDASLLAELGGRPVGVLLASRLSRGNGHICQVSVLPGAQTGGVGTQLMLASLGAFRSSGVAHATLSVTVNNRRAYALYQRLGFRLHREFAAHAWVRPPARLELPA